jgi:aspartate/methionine/tyrosine aminotransferase
MDLRPFALERWFARHEFTARWLLGSSDPESLAVDDLLALVPGGREALLATWLGYTETRGHPDLRRKVAAGYATLAEEHVLFHAGAEEALFCLFATLLSPGDRVVVQAPFYGSHAELPRALGATVVPWAARESAGWAPDLDELGRLLETPTRAVVICSPHNPTGHLFEEAEWATLVAHARRAGAWVVSDEVYRGSERAPRKPLPAMADAYERGVSVGGLAKVHALAGLRTGWVASRDTALLDGAVMRKDYLSICNAAPAETLASLALDVGEALCARTRARLEVNLAEVERFLARHQDLFAWNHPRAGTTVFPRLRRGGAEAFCEALVRERGVLLVPSHLLEFGDAHVRLGYGRASLPDALAVLEEHLSGGPAT